MSSQRNRSEKLPLLETIRAMKNKNQIFKLILVLVLVFVFYNLPKEYLGDTYPICLYRIIFKHNCLGCGTTRAIWSILHFNFNQAFEYNRLIIITFPLLAGCIISWVARKQSQ
jgi:hypothetical protein